MSSTSTYELFSTKVNNIGEYRNSWGSGPAVWDYISTKLYGKKFNIMDDRNFWGCYKDDRLTIDELCVLLSTYDRAYVRVDKLLEFADSCEKVHRKLLETTNWEWSHLESIAKDARSLYNVHDHRAKGLCIGCTSVADAWEGDIKTLDVWDVYEEIERMKTDDQSWRVSHE